MVFFEPIIKVVLSWLASFVGELIKKYLAKLAADKRIQEQADRDRKQNEQANTPEERDEATRNLADHSF